MYGSPVDVAKAGKSLSASSFARARKTFHLFPALWSIVNRGTAEGNSFVFLVHRRKVSPGFGIGNVNHKPNPNPRIHGNGQASSV